MSGIDLDNITIDEFIDNFETGTEGRKEWKQRFKVKPKPGDHCCIADIGRFESTASEAKKRTKRRSMDVDTPMDVNTRAAEEEQENEAALSGEEDDTKMPNSHCHSNRVPPN
eukprot:scaffold5459_cov86-Skeletonema_dohrnii-CCMP3373.AAC.1